MAKEVPFDPEKLMAAARNAQGAVNSAMDEYRLGDGGYRLNNLPAPTFSQLPPAIQRQVANAMFLSTNPIFDSRVTYGQAQPQSRWYAPLAGGLDWQTVLMARADGRLDENFQPVPNMVSDAERAALGQVGVDEANLAVTGDQANQSTLGMVDDGQRDLNAMIPGYDTPMPTAPKPQDRTQGFLYNAVQSVMAAQDAGLSVEETRRFLSARTHYSPGGVYGGDQSQRAAWLLANYPTLAATAEQQGWSPDEVAKTTNFVLAQDTAIKVLSQNDEYRARQMLASIPAAQKSLVYDLMGEISRDMERQRRLQEKMTYDDPLVVQAGKFLWNVPILGPGAIFNGLNWAWEQGQHIGRAWLYAFENGQLNDKIDLAALAVPMATGNVPLAASGLAPLKDAWSKTEHGQFDAQMLTDAVRKYGPKQVEVAQAAFAARLQGDTEAYVSLLDRFGDDPQARLILAHAFDDINTDEQVQDLIKEVSAANNANLGNLSARALHLDPTSDFTIGIGDINPFELTRDVSNVVGTFTLDPTLAAGLVGKGISGLRYGIYLLMDEERAARLFANPAATKLGKVADAFTGKTAVRRYFNWFGGELERVRGLTGLERSQAITTLRSQSSRYIPADVLESMLKFGVKDASTAHDWLQGADNLMAIMRGQSAKHVKDMRVPHMSAMGQVAKRTSLAARGLDPTRVIARKAQQELEAAFGPEFVNLPADEQLRIFVEAVQDEEQAARIAAAVSDLRNVDSGGVRTVIGRIVDRLSRNSDTVPEWTQRYGWKRKKGESIFGAFQVRADRLSRALARMPDTAGGIRTDTAVDADKVYEMMRLAGVPRYWASYFRAAWVEMNQAQRRLSMIGLTRTFGIASGIDLVSPEKGMQELIEGMTGFRVTEKYAPNVARRMPNIAARAENDVDTAIGARPLGQSPEQAAQWDATRKAMIESRRAELIREEGLDLIEPDTFRGISSAVWWGQTRDRMALPNFQAIDRLRARQSYMGSMFMRNRVGQGVTDWWTLAVLAGPRFSLRNGIEDFSFYALTEGSMSNFWRGRQASTAMREAIMRSDINIVEARTRVDSAKAALDKARLSGAATEDQINRLERSLAAAEKHLSDERSRRAVRGQKLGIVKTAMRKVGDRLPVMQRFILPNLTADEIYDAAKAAEAGDREVLANLVVKAFLRQKLLWLKNDDAKLLSARLAKGAARDDLSPRMQAILNDLDDFAQSTYATGLMDEVSETSRHLVDGTMSGSEDAADVVIGAGRTLYRRVRFGNVDYITQRVRSGSPAEVRAIIANLHMALHSDGPKGQRAMKLLPAYFEALAQGDAGAAKAQEIVQQLSKFLGTKPEDYDYAARFGLANQPAVDRLSQATLDTLAGMFTKQDGKFNEELYRALKVPGSDAEFPQFRVHYTDAEGNQIDNVTMADFAEGVMPMPQYTLMRESDSMWVAESMPWRDHVWAAMGRSLARMTREPIYISNYLESRAALRPMEQRLVKIGFTEDQARNMMTELAGDRALNLSMSYVDNPSVRSQMAWALRNVARFYRAQEDFIRRMWRTAENNPMAFWKASLAWNAAQNSGFVHTDQYGEQYFIYPGSRAAIEATKWITDKVFLNTDMSMISSVPMNFTGKLSWLTPSADIEAWAPTLSSPWAAISVRPLLRALPITSAVERNLFGAIGEDKSVVDTIIPPNVTRAINVLTTITNTRDTPLQYLGGTLAASSARKAMLMLAATGQMPTDGAMDDNERLKWADRIDKLATGTMLLQLAAGLFLPASPQLSTDDVTKFARELGLTGFRPEFVARLANRKPGETIEDVQIGWLQDYGLDKAIYMESESESTDRGYWPATEGNVKFMEANKDVVDDNPVGASFFAPQTGNETFMAYKIISSLGLQQKRDPMRYLQRLTEAKGRGLLVLWQMDLENKLKAATTQEEADIIIAGMGELKKDINSNFGISGKENPGWNSPVDYSNTWGLIVSAGSILAERRDPVAMEMAPFISAVASKKSEIDRLKDSIDPDASKRLTEIKDGWYAMMAEAMQHYDNKEPYMNILKAGTYFLWPAQGTQWPWDITEVGVNGG